MQNEGMLSVTLIVCFVMTFQTFQLDHPSPPCVNNHSQTFFFGWSLITSLTLMWLGGSCWLGFVCWENYSPQRWYILVCLSVFEWSLQALLFERGNHRESTEGVYCRCEASILPTVISKSLTDADSFQNVCGGSYCPCRIWVPGRPPTWKT